MNSVRARCVNYWNKDSSFSQVDKWMDGWWGWWANIYSCASSYTCCNCVLFYIYTRCVGNDCERGAPAMMEGKRGFSWIRQRRKTGQTSFQWMDDEDDVVVDDEDDDDLRRALWMDILERKFVGWPATYAAVVSIDCTWGWIRKTHRTTLNERVFVALMDQVQDKVKCEGKYRIKWFIWVLFWSWECKMGGWWLPMTECMRRRWSKT